MDERFSCQCLASHLFSWTHSQLGAAKKVLLPLIAEKLHWTIYWKCLHQRRISGQSGEKERATYRLIEDPRENVKLPKAWNAYSTYPWICSHCSFTLSGPNCSSGKDLLLSDMNRFRILTGQWQTHRHASQDINRTKSFGRVSQEE